MLMPNFMHVFNAYTSQTYMNMLYKNTSGNIVKDEHGIGNSMAIGIYADTLWHMSPVGDYTPDNFYKGSMVFVGNGTTEPTVDDYNLESLIEYSAKGLHVEAEALAYNENEDHYKINRIMTVVLRNNSNNDITISELGWFIAVPQQYGADKESDHYRMMLAREVIEPVTIKPGEVRAFTMSIEM